jgi:hypothetical protein
LKVIGAGLPRTGTLTQKVALEMLGFGPCYHMVNVLADFGQVAQWREVLDGGRDWDRVLAGYQSGVDWPVSFFYRELLETYPDAKVLLSVRDPEGWERSMRETIWGALTGDSLIHDLAKAAGRINPAFRGYTELMSDMWDVAGAYAADAEGQLEVTLERHVDVVRNEIPAEQLLIWDVSEGWKPLCEFLAVPAPQVPLPHLNDSIEFRDRVVQMTLQMLGDWWSSEQASRPAGPAPN